MKKLVLPILLVGLLAGCSSDDVIDPVKPVDPVKPESFNVPLIISSVSTEDELLEKDSIGVILSEGLDKISSLMEYLAPGGKNPTRSVSSSRTDSKGFLSSWHAKDPVKKHYLNNEISEYKLFAFAPYDSKFKLDVPMEMMPQEYKYITGQRGRSYSDFCYGYKSNINFKNQEADLSLQHLYSRITLVVSRSTNDPYDNNLTGELQQIDFSGKGIFKTAKASFKNFKNIVFTDTKTELVKMPLTDVFLSSGQDKIGIGFLMIPASAKDFSAPIALDFTLDGSKISGEIPYETPKKGGLNELSSGIHYYVEVAVSKNKLEVVEVKIIPWGRELDFQI